MNFKFHKKILCLLFFVIAIPFCAFSDSSSSIDSLEMENKTWSLSASNDINIRFYLTSKPIETITTHKNKRDPYVQIMCLKNNEYQIALNNDYTLYKPPVVSINGQDFLFASNQANSLFSYAKPQDVSQILKKFSNSFEIKVLSHSVSGTYSVDTYTLASFQKLFIQLQRMCGEEDF